LKCNGFPFWDVCIYIAIQDGVRTRQHRIASKMIYLQTEKHL